MKKEPPAGKIQVTKDYRLFSYDRLNRPVDLKKRRALEKSMANNGFFWYWPIVCYRNKAGGLVIKDGQHRFEAAKRLGLAVFYVIGKNDFDTATVNSTQKAWVLKDYLTVYARNGFKHYQSVKDFSETHDLPISAAFQLLGGTVSISAVAASIRSGQFKVKDYEWPNAVVAIRAPMVGMSTKLNNHSFLKACMAACRVEKFQAKRLLKNAERCRDKLESYSTRDAYLEMLQEIYNYGYKSRLFSLKIEAQMAMRGRNPANGGKK